VGTTLHQLYHRVEGGAKAANGKTVASVTRPGEAGLNAVMKAVGQPAAELGVLSTIEDRLPHDRMYIFDGRRADIHDGLEHDMPQSEAGYIDASMKTSCDAYQRLGQIRWWWSSRTSSARVSSH
jgi:hypothetical protein